MVCRITVIKSEDCLPSSKTAKALSEILGISRDVMSYVKLKKDATKNSSSRYNKGHFLNHLAHIQVQVLKQRKEINEAIVEWSANSKEVSDKTPIENHMKRDPVIAKKHGGKIKLLLNYWKYRRLPFTFLNKYTFFNVLTYNTCIC